MSKAKNNKQETFVIIDGNAIVHRAYHAMPPLTAKDGTMINAVFGFTSMLLKVFEKLQPDYVAISFDVAGGTFRDKVYKEYKAKRIKADQELYDQIPLCYEIVKAFNIPIYTKEGFEADDIIGTVVSGLEKNNPKVKKIIVTGDMDMLQLVHDHDVQVFLLRKGISDTELYDESKVKERFGFGPEHIVDYKSLRGDSSDNIPGIKGIGEKTATDLIKKIGSVNDIYENLKNRKSKIYKDFTNSMILKLEQGHESAMMSKELATIRQDIKELKFKLDDCKASDFDAGAVAALFKKFEFYSLLKRIPGMKTNEPGSVPDKPGSEIFAHRSLSKCDLEKIYQIIKKEKIFACKEIWEGKNMFEGKLGSLVFVSGKSSCVVDFDAASKKEKDIVRSIFSDQNLMLVGHDLKQLIKVLMLSEIKCANKLFDVMIASYIINSSTRAHDLNAILMRENDSLSVKKNEQANLFVNHKENVAGELSEMLIVQKKYEKQLNEIDDKGLFERVEMALIRVLADMELNGVFVDAPALKQLSKDITKQIEKLTAQIHKQAGEKFNIASSVQLRDVLFEKLKIPTHGIKKGKTGYSTAAPELEKLREEHPIISLIEEYREFEKLRNTYVDVLPTLIDKKTGRIHTNFNQAVTTTGRLSSSDPNLQNIPIRTDLGREIRKAFVSEKGYFLVVADYSQIELRIVASLAQDKNLIEIFKKGEDVHRATASIIQGVPLKDVTKEMRSNAKAINFGVLYGMGAYGLSWRTGLSAYESRDFIKKYFEKFSNVKKYLDNTIKFAKDQGYVETLFGRRRYIPELKSDNFQLRNAGERMAINMPVQGTAADLMKMAMINVYAKIKKEFKKEDVKFLLQVHDELVLEVKKGLEKKVSTLLKKEMESVAELRVPIIAEVHFGHSWGEIK
jgi:DNA polymerase-1